MARQSDVAHRSSRRSAMSWALYLAACLAAKAARSRASLRFPGVKRGWDKRVTETLTALEALASAADAG